MFSNILKMFKISKSYDNNRNWEPIIFFLQSDFTCLNIELKNCLTVNNWKTKTFNQINVLKLFLVIDKRIDEYK